MARQIVVCSDGTGNSWSTQVSNVSRLIQLIDLSHSDAAGRVLRPGHRHRPEDVDAVNDVQERERRRRRALTILDPPFTVLVVPSDRPSGSVSRSARPPQQRQRALQGAGAGYEDGPPGHASISSDSAAARSPFGCWPVSFIAAGCCRRTRARSSSVQTGLPALQAAPARLRRRRTVQA